MANEARIQILEQIKAGQIPDRAAMEQNFSQEERVKLLEALRGRVKVNPPPQGEPVRPVVVRGELIQPNPLSAQLRSEGIDPSSPAPAGARLRAGFAATEEDARAYLQRELSKRFNGAPVSVQMKPNGRMAYLNPETGVWSDVAGGDINLGDIAAAVGPAIPPLAGGVAAASAFLTGAGAPLSAAAGGAAAGAAEAARVEIGEAMGVSPERTGQTTGLAAQAALRGTAEELVGVGFAKAVNRLLGGPSPISADEARSILVAAESSKGGAASAQDIVTELRQRGYDFKPTAGQLSGLQDILDKEATARATSIGARARADYQTLQRQNTEALQQFFNDNLGISVEVAKEDAGRAARRAVEELVETRVGAPSRALSQQRATVAADIDDIGVLNRPLAGRAIREGLVAASERAKSVEREAWSRVDNLAQVDPETGRSAIRLKAGPETLDTLKSLRSQMQNAPFEWQGTQLERLLRGRLADDLAEGGLGEMDLTTLSRTISDMKRLERAAYSATDPNLPAAAKVVKLRKALEADRDAFLKDTNPALLRQIKVAEAETKKYYDTFTRGLVGDLLREDGPGFKLNDYRAYNAIFKPGNIEAAEEVARIVQQDSRALEAARDSIRGLYRQQVFRRGEPSVAAHKAFMRDFGEVVRPFLSEREVKQIASTGNLLEVMERESRRIKLVEDTLRASFPGKIAGRGLNNESLVDEIFKGPRTEGGAGLSNEQLRNTMRFLDINRPQAAQGLRDAARDEIRRRISDPDTGGIDLKRLDSFLAQEGEEEVTARLRVVLGERYVRDLTAFKNAFRLTGREGAPLPEEPRDMTVLGWIRTRVWNPLSREGRIFTDYQKRGERFLKEDLARILSDPEQLRILIANADTKMKTEAAALALAQLGLVDPDKINED